jgi:Zn-dependent protease with chaperone function
VGAIIETALFWCFYKTVKCFQRRWPYLLLIGSVPIILCLTLLAPLVIEPIFNKIEPMADSALRRDIANLASKAGLSNAPVFVSDRHKQSNELNAYVTGLGSSARIVLWDTTITKLPADQVLCVIAHELGHYRLNHVFWGCAIAIAMSLLLLPVNLFCTPVVFANLPEAWRIGSIEDNAGIPFIVLAATCIGFFFEPAINTYSRSIEYQADLYGFNLYANKTAFALTFVSLAKQNLADPLPPKLIRLWSFSHPSLGERIISAMESGR